MGLPPKYHRFDPTTAPTKAITKIGMVAIGHMLDRGYPENRAFGQFNMGWDSLANTPVGDRVKLRSPEPDDDDVLLVNKL